MVRVVVVDDDEGLGKSFCEILAMHGFEAHFVQWADEAVSYINKICAEALVSDLVMPVTTGDKLVEDVRKNCPTIRFVAIFSGIANDQYARKAAEKIQCPLFKKVDDDKTLIKTMKDVLKD